MRRKGFNPSVSLVFFVMYERVREMVKVEHVHCWIQVTVDKDHIPTVTKFLENDLIISKREYNPILHKYRSRHIRLYKTLEEFPDFTFITPSGFLPRFLNFLNQKQIPVDYTPNYQYMLKADWDNVRVAFRNLQEDCLKSIDNVLNKGLGGVVVAPPAFGKTFLISAITQLYPQARIHVISKRRDVVLSNYRTVCKYTPDVGLVTSGSRDTGKRVTIFTADSLAHSDFMADLVILDEVHELVTTRYYKILSNYACPKVGLTATPDTRYDNLHYFIEGLCGPTIFEVSYQEATESSLVVPIAVIWYLVSGNESYVDPLSRRRFGIWRNEKRNSLIARIAKEHFSAGRQTLILVETVEHALSLHKLLPEFELCYSHTKHELLDWNSEVPPISEKKRQELYEKFVSRELLGVIATGVWSVGVSFNNLEVLIRAEGSGSKTAATQAPGRVCRISDMIHKPMGIVIDFIDAFDKTLLNKSIERYKCYKKHNWYQFDENLDILFPERLYGLRKRKS